LSERFRFHWPLLGFYSRTMVVRVPGDSLLRRDQRFLDDARGEVFICRFEAPRVQ
jgi:hypothetical protein